MYNILLGNFAILYINEQRIPIQLNAMKTEWMNERSE